MQSQLPRAFSRILATLALFALPAISSNIYYTQNNLVSDIPGLAPVTDPNLVNPWGLSASATSPWWISDNGTGLATVYSGITGTLAKTVTVPPPAGGTPPSAPDGQIFNTTTGFKVGGAAASFIFDAEDGTISAWNSTAGNSAVLEVDNSASGAVYKGLALSGSNLYAANFNSGNIDVFNSSFGSVGSFADPTIPAGYAPFNVQSINGVMYVTYALQNAAKHDDVAGLGNGFVDIFNPNTNTFTRLISNGPLDSPWGVAIAPSNFGTFSGDLLVGNFGDGIIDAFNPTTGALVGDLTDANGNPIVIQGLWGLAFGNGASAGPTNALYFTAGIAGPGGQVEENGLFGDIVASPEPSAIWLALTGIVGILIARRRLSAGHKP